MNDPIFAKTRFDYENPENGYGSYHDYWRLVKYSGFPTCYIDEIDTASDNVYIFSPRNGEVGDGWPGARARIIHWNLEQYGYEPLAGVAETWVSDARLAKEIEARYVLMGSHESLRYPGDTERCEHYHVAMLAYMTPRREAVASELTARGVKIIPNSWYKDRHIALSNTSAMLHVHQNDNIRYVAPQRFALAAAYSLPLITETLDDWGAFTYSNIMAAHRDYITDFVVKWTMRNEARILADYGCNLYHFLCKYHTFRKGVEAAL